MNMRWLKDRDDRLKTKPPKSCDQLWSEGNRVFASGKRGKFELRTWPCMNVCGEVYLTAQWLKVERNA